MPHQQVKKSIEVLENELKKTPKETAVLEKKLHHAQEGIEEYAPEALKDFSAFLHREVEEFEIEHPQIVALINQVTTALSNLGI